MNEEIHKQALSSKFDLPFRRKLWLRIRNKNSFMFLLFFTLSAIFWLIMSLSEIVDKEVKIPIKLTNVPKNIVITSDIEDTLTVTVRDKAYIIATYWYFREIKQVQINFSILNKNNEKAILSGTDLIHSLYQTLNNSTKIIETKPDKIEWFYNHGNNKKVKVRLKGCINPRSGFLIRKIDIIPNTIDVYASQDILNSIAFVNTEYININDISDTIVKTINLEKTKGVKVIPTKVKIKIYPALLTEKTIEVPITTINVPENKVLRIFPSTIKVKFTTDVGSIPTLHTEAFRVEADYNNLLNNETKCKITLVASPQEAKNARLTLDKVDYLIEQL